MTLTQISKSIEYNGYIPLAAPSHLDKKHHITKRYRPPIVMLAERNKIQTNQQIRLLFAPSHKISSNKIIVNLISTKAILKHKNT